MTSLTDREHHILELREEGLTLETIGKRLGITRERVRQIESKAKRKLLQTVSKLECPQCHNIRPRVYINGVCKCSECGKEFIYDSRA